MMKEQVFMNKSKRAVLAAGLMVGLMAGGIMVSIGYPADETSGEANTVESATPSAGGTVVPATSDASNQDQIEPALLGEDLFAPEPILRENPERGEGGRRRPGWGGPMGRGGPLENGPGGHGPGGRGPGGGGAGGGGPRSPFGRGGEERRLPSPMRENLDSPERLARLRVENPQLADLIENTRRVTYQIGQLLAEYGRTEDTARKNQILQKLRPLLEKEFEMEIQRQHMEIQMMEKRLEQLKSALKRREENRQRLLQFRLENLLKGPREPFHPPGGPENGMEELPEASSRLEYH